MKQTLIFVVMIALAIAATAQPTAMQAVSAGLSNLVPIGPEPTTMSLLAAGLIALGLARRQAR